MKKQKKKRKQRLSFSDNIRIPRFVPAPPLRLFGSPKVLLIHRRFKHYSLLIGELRFTDHYAEKATDASLRLLNIRPVCGSSPTISSTFKATVTRLIRNFYWTTDG